jgi:hypothetical protein
MLLVGQRTDHSERPKAELAVFDFSRWVVTKISLADG